MLMEHQCHGAPTHWNAFSDPSFRLKLSFSQRRRKICTKKKKKKLTQRIKHWRKKESYVYCDSPLNSISLAQLFQVYKIVAAFLSFNFLIKNSNEVKRITTTINTRRWRSDESGKLFFLRVFLSSFSAFHFGWYSAIYLHPSHHHRRSYGIMCKSSVSFMLPLREKKELKSPAFHERSGGSGVVRSHFWHGATFNSQTIHFTLHTLFVSCIHIKTFILS